MAWAGRNEVAKGREISRLKVHETKGRKQSLKPEISSGGIVELDSDILTVAEVAYELRCSKAHVYKAIRGNVAGVSRLPVISMGRRKLIRRSTLEQWKKANEHEGSGAIIEPPEINAVGRVGGNHA